MNAPREGDEQDRYHIWLFKEDVQLVDTLWGNSVGRSRAIRIILRKALASLRAQAEAKSKTPEGSAELVDDLLKDELEGDAHDDGTSRERRITPK